MGWLDVEVGGKMNILNKNVEYIIIQNEETKEIVAKITQDNCDVIKPYVIRVKEISINKD